MPTATEARPEVIERMLQRVEDIRRQNAFADGILDAQEMSDELEAISESLGSELTAEEKQAAVRTYFAEQFALPPQNAGLSNLVARGYVQRRKVGFFAAAAIAIPVATVGLWNAPATISSYMEAQKAAQLEVLATQPEALRAEIATLAVEPAAIRKATDLATLAQSYISAKNTESAEDTITQLGDLQAVLNQSYELKIANRDGYFRRLWRGSRSNSMIKNYYVIAHAIDPSGREVPVDILDEETGKKERVTIWGERVDEQTYENVGRDIHDDGIAQQDHIGSKRRGYLSPQYDLPVQGGKITRGLQKR